MKARESSPGNLAGSVILMDPALVFIHLGSKVPKYLAPNLKRTAKLFPSIDVCVAGNSEEIELVAAMNNVRYIPVAAEFGNPKLVSSQARRTSLDLAFWGGYWQKTLDRLIAFEEIHSQLGDRPMIHIEGDVILMPGFPFAEVTKSSCLRWVGYSEHADIASIVYSPSVNESSWFSSVVLEVAADNSSLTDMDILRKIRLKNPGRIELFPPLPDPKKANPQWVFDGSQFGDWLFGQDPHAHWGLKKRRMKTTDFSKEFENYRFQVVEDRLEVCHANGVGQIANLHVHSKEMRFFQENIEGPLSALIDQVRHERVFYGFDLKACLDWSRSRLKRWSRSAFRLDTWKRLFSS